MGDHTAEESLSSTLESGLCDDVQALFKDMSSQTASQKGMIPWILQRKVEDFPSCSVSLIPILVKRLEKKLTKVSKSHDKKTYMPIIPVLHTLYYVVIQSAVSIPKSLYQNVSECLAKLLILPSPYSTVALHTLRSIKMEMAAPGSLYLRRVIAEQNMKNEHFTMREKVFVLADPAVFSAPLEATVKAYLNMSSRLRNIRTMEKTVLFHVLETALEMTCESSRLAQALEVLEDHVVKEYFQDVVQAVNQSRGHYLNTLKQIHKNILAASDKEIINGDQGPAYSTIMPFPEITFLMWKDEEILWDLLADFTLNSGSKFSKDGRERLSRDSGTVKNLQVTESDDAETPPDRNLRQPERRNAWRRRKSLDQMILMTEKVVSGNASRLKEERSHTARVVIMGNDCTLGKVARAYYAIREKESKRNMLTKKLDLQFYYIPVSGAEPFLSSPDESRLSLASCLERVDPWYSINISSLGATIPTLPELPPVYTKPSEMNLYLLDTMCYYLRCGTQPVNLPVYSVKITPCNSDANSVEELFVSHLEADIPEFRHLKDHRREPSIRQKKSSVELFGVVLSVSYTKASMSRRDVKGEASMAWRVTITSEPAASASGENYLTASFDSLNPAYNTTIQTQNISIKTMEHRTMCVCLDKDPSRTYTDIQRLEISPCLDPGVNIQTRHSIRNKRDLPLNKYLDKVLSVPINTFSGVTI